MLDIVARRYRTALNAFFRRRLGAASSEYEDLTQEVFFRLAKRSGAQDIREIEAYVFQAAAAVMVDHVRRCAARPQQSGEPYDDLLHAPQDFSPERVMLGREQAARVLAAIEALPERARCAFLLFRFERLRQAEIASRMGISVSAVEKHVKLGMIRVAAALEHAE